MKAGFPFVLFLHALGASSAVYKEWIPNTNFENASNWDKGRVPCPNDVILFRSSEVVSIFTESSHSLTDMYIPLNGEFILGPGAGFAAFDNSFDPGCETASEVTFATAQNFQWYDPALWNAATSSENLDRGKYIFSVDEERVPCQYDDVIFQPGTSFRVNTGSPEQTIRLRSLSVMGQKFTSDSSLAEYMQSYSAKLQFHGQGIFQLSNSRCPDKSGCECGNTAVHDRICGALLQNLGDRCPEVMCKDPLKPVGHCCGICGASISLEYSSAFDIELYRDRILHTLLNLPKNAGLQMAISKVREARTFLGILPRGSDPFIQIVLIDSRTGSETGTHAEETAKAIMQDIAEHGASFGILSSTLQIATGSDWAAQNTGGHVDATAAATISAVLVLLLIGIALLLYRKGQFRFLTAAYFTSLWNQKRSQDLSGATEDKGFDNPMFDIPSDPVALAGGEAAEEVANQNANRNRELYYFNPLYDETEHSA